MKNEILIFSVTYALNGSKWNFFCRGERVNTTLVSLLGKFFDCNIGVCKWHGLQITYIQSKLKKNLSVSLFTNFKNLVTRMCLLYFFYKIISFIDSLVLSIVSPAMLLSFWFKLRKWLKMSIQVENSLTQQILPLNAVSVDFDSKGKKRHWNMQNLRLITTSEK